MKKIYVCTLAVFLSFGVIFYLILTILLPVTYRRSFTVLTSEEKNYVLECYVPGRASHAIVTNDSGKARITYSEKDNGTLVQIETKSRPGFLNILNVSIWFALRMKKNFCRNSRHHSVILAMKKKCHTIFWKMGRKQRRFRRMTRYLKEKRGRSFPFFYVR